jgi:DNA-directed RNA polymerase subunit RPC12/RpoP
MKYFEGEILNLKMDRIYAKNHPNEFPETYHLFRFSLLLGVIGLCLYFNPVSSGEYYFNCPNCEREIGFELKDQEKSWRCKRCGIYNSKSHPPYNCGSCGCGMGKE